MKPFSDSELHALVDGQLDPLRASELEAWLIQDPDGAQRVADYRLHKRQIRALFDPVVDEETPTQLQQAARAPWRLPAYGRWVAGFVFVLLSGAAGWQIRDLQATETTSMARASEGNEMARRAAVAHAVYTPELRRPVEVDAAHEDQLVAWLSRRMGAAMKPPHLQAFGYALEGGRLLPGEEGPVAQFMYRDESGGRLTLYVTREASAESAKRPTTAFRFAREGKVNVFYWIDGGFGYALSAEADRAELSRVSGEVYRQLSP